LAIPNLEIQTIYEDIIINYLKEDEKILSSVNSIIKCLIENEFEKFERLLRELYLKQVSFFDVGKRKVGLDDLDEIQQDEKFESFHHGFMLGLFVQMDGNYKIDSNIEYGLGRPDIVIIPNDNTKDAYIFEFKWESTKGAKTLDALTYEAVKQIRDKKYREGLIAKYGHKNIICIGIGFKGKEIKISYDG
jgi:hypothetical protein